jgi:hypothetical protein
MLIIPPPQFRRRRRLKIQAAKPAPPVVGPLVVGAVFDENTLELQVDFDRAVSVDGFVPSALVVNDPGMGAMFQADVAELVGDASVRFVVEVTGPSSGSQAWMTASGGNGIVAADDGTPWAGVTELALPFP